MIGFSPRGTGNSTLLLCESDALLRDVSLSRLEAEPQLAADIEHNGRLTAQACQNNDLSDHIHTEAVVQDMDLARHLLGDEQLNLVGASYGTNGRHDQDCDHACVGV